MSNDEGCFVGLAQMNIFETVLGILLALAVGVCIVTFPFVLWMLFGR